MHKDYSNHLFKQTTAFQSIFYALYIKHRNFGGTGLGLWIAKNIIEMMGGRVQIESEIGQGSNFMIILPLFSGNEEYVLQEKEIDIGDLQNAYKGLNILYVEDICENQIVMSHLLAEMGFEITLANNGAEGLYQFKQKRKEFFNLILTDLRMPNMSGQTMIMKIREYEQEYIYIYIYIYIGVA